MARRKYTELCNTIKGVESAIVGFSGGVDSAVLLKATHEVLGPKCLAITAVSLTSTREDINFAKSVAKQIGANHKIVTSNEFENSDFLNNSVDRCYLCKKTRFNDIKSIATELSFETIFEGSNTDDLGDYRPGKKAITELDIRSPLIEANISKKDVREIAKFKNLSVWNRPSNPCLATRIPFGTKLTEDNLKKVEIAENSLKTIGFKIVRVRNINNEAIIEVGANELSHLNKVLAFVDETMTKIGFDRTTITTYNKGSMLNYGNKE